MTGQPQANSPQQHVWFYQKSTLLSVEDIGPLTEAQMLTLAQNGTLSLNTPIRCPTRTKNRWINAEQVPAFADAIRKAAVEAAARKKQEADEKRQAADERRRARQKQISKPAPPTPPATEPFEMDTSEPFGEPWPGDNRELGNPGFTNRSTNLLEPVHSVRSTTYKTRYPNLHRYMVILRSVLVIAFLFAILFALGTIVVGIVAAANSVGAARGTGLFLSFLTALGIFGFGYLYYVIGMAGLEFIKVVIDIESNTRKR